MLSGWNWGERASRPLQPQESRIAEVSDLQPHQNPNILKPANPPKHGAKKRIRNLSVGAFQKPRWCPSRNARTSQRQSLFSLSFEGRERTFKGGKKFLGPPPLRMEDPHPTGRVSGPKNPVSPYPLNLSLGGEDSPHKFRGRPSKNCKPRGFGHSAP